MRILDWKEVSLGECVDLLTGFPFKSQQFTDNPKDIPLVKGANVHQGYIDWNDAKRWSGSEYDKYEKFQLQTDDVVVAMDRPWIEAGLKYAWIRSNDPKCLLVQRVARLRGINGLLTSYLRYLIGSSDFTNYIKPIVTGVNVPHISADQIKGFKFFLPPVSVQQRIVDILSAYDRLIENNTRRIKILEEMARSLYDEWFVKFRFPGHEQTKFVDSELGLTPEDWEVGKLEDALILQRGFDLPTKQRKEGIIPVYASTGITGTHDEAKVKAPGVVTGRSGSLGTVIYADEDFWPLNTTLWVKEFRKVTPIYAFYLLDRLELEQYNSGAAVPTLNRNDIHGLPVVIPSPSQLQKFDHHIQPILKLKKNLLTRNGNLRQTRDLLLPKLISGETDVEKLEMIEGKGAISSTGTVNDIRQNVIAS